MQRVYIANHSRAILDLLYRSLHRWGRVLNLTGATTDWLDTKEQGEQLLEQATMLESSLPPSLPPASYTAGSPRSQRAEGGVWTRTRYQRDMLLRTHSTPAVQMDCLVFPPPPPRSLAKRTPAERRRLAISNQPMFTARSYAYDRDDHADPRAA